MVGFYARLAAATPAPTAETDLYATYARTPATWCRRVARFSMENEVSVATSGPDVYTNIRAGVFQTGSGEAAIEAIKRRCRSCMASVYVPAANAIDAHFRLQYHPHSGGPNGGAMRGDSIAAVWPTLNLIRDIYTQAASGVTVLTWLELSGIVTRHFEPMLTRGLAFQI